jgi:hypothetical protein
MKIQVGARSATPPASGLMSRKARINADSLMSEEQQGKPGVKAVSRRAFLGIASAGLVTTTVASLAVDAPERGDIPRAENEQSAIKVSDKQFQPHDHRFSETTYSVNFSGC